MENKKNKKAFILWTFILIIHVGSIGYMSFLYYNGVLRTWNGEKIEYLVYAFWALTYSFLFHYMSDRVWERTKKILIAHSLSFGFVLQVMLVNNFWKYIRFNSMFNWEEPLSYFQILWQDITYMVGIYGKIRYYIAFLLMLAMMALGIGIKMLMSKAMSSIMKYIIASDDELALVEEKPKQYLYSKSEGIVIKDEFGMHNTTLLYSKADAFKPRRVNYIWIDSITASEDNTIELKLGYTDGNDVQNGYSIVHPIIEDYQKMKIIVDMVGK